MRLLFLIILNLLLIVGCKTTQQTTQSTTPQPTQNRSDGVLSALDIEVRQAYVDASTQMVRGDLLKARELFQRVLELDPENHAAQFNLAKLALTERDYEQAISFANQALQRETENYWYYQILQQAYEEKGDYANAIEQLETITTKFPRRIAEKTHLSELYFKNDQTEAALNTLDEIESQIGFDFETSLRKLSLNQQLGRSEEVLTITAKLIEQEPENGQFYQIRYEEQLGLGQSDAAVQTLEQWLENDPENGFALSSLAKYHLERGEVEKAQAYQLQIFENPQVEIGSKLYLMRELQQQESPAADQQFLQFAKLLYQAHPLEASAQAIHAQAFVLQGELDSARTYYKRSLDQDPSALEIWSELLQLEFEHLAMPWLLKDGEEAVELFPNQDQFLYYYGMAALHQEANSQAQYAFNKVWKRRRATAALLGEVGTGLAQLASQKGEVAEEQSLLGTAESLLKKALDEDEEDYALMDAYGYLLYHQGNYNKAIQWFTQAEKADPNTKSIRWERLGDAQFKKGNRTQAQTSWQKARELGAQSLNIEKKLKEL